MINRIVTTATSVLLSFTCPPLAQGTDERAGVEDAVAFFPRSIEFSDADDYAPRIPFIWLSLDAFNEGDVGLEAIPYESTRRIVANNKGELVDHERCTELVYEDSPPNLHSLPRDEASAYLKNPWGLIAATVLDEQGGFFYGEPYRLLALEVTWLTQAAEAALPTTEHVLAAVPEVTIAFGDQVLCKRLTGTTEPLLQVGTDFLFFPPEALPRDGFLHLNDLRHLAVSKQGRVVGAEHLLSNLDLDSENEFGELKDYLRREMESPQK